MPLPPLPSSEAPTPTDGEPKAEPTAEWIVAELDKIRVELLRRTPNRREDSAAEQDPRDGASR